MDQLHDIEMIIESRTCLREDLEYPVSTCRTLIGVDPAGCFSLELKLQLLAQAELNIAMRSSEIK